MPAARRAAARAADAGHHQVAGQLMLAIGAVAEGARELEMAGAYREAARAHKSAGAPREAARCLEAALTRDAQDHAARLELGRLLYDNAKTCAAVRVLQAIPDTASQWREALPVLRAAFEGLGLVSAAQEAAARMTELSIEPLEDSAAPRSGSARGELLFGRYQTQRLVATTPTARVHEAVDRISGERVAVKIFAVSGLSDAGRDALERFEREARALDQLRHPAIVPLLAWLPEGPAVVLPWMAGGSLADLLAESAMAPARAAEITLAVLAALGEAHRRGILHRDIKPANVLFDASGAAFLADFGTAHVSDSAATVTAGVIGTLAYMAPEQRGGAPADMSSDVYGAGALFWHALTGAPPGAKLPFLSDELGDRHQSIARRLIGEKPERPADAPSAAALIESVAWPRTAPAARQADAPLSVPPPARSVRLEPIDGALHHDTLLNRRVYVFSADAPTLERVLPYARADHPSLPAVLTLAQETGSVWVEAVSGVPLGEDIDTLTRTTLAEALAALHRAGGYHGRIDRDHVVLRGGRVMLRFAAEPRTRGAAADLEALATL